MSESDSGEQEGCVGLPPGPGARGVAENKQRLNKRRCFQIKAMSSTKLRTRVQEKVSGGEWSSDQGVTEQCDVKRIGKTRGPY